MYRAYYGLGGTLGMFGVPRSESFQRILSLTGLLQLNYPLFTTVNGHLADLQDLIFNETWFLAEGVLWGILGWMNLGPSRARRWWIGTALAAIAALIAAGLLTTFGVISKTNIG
jgi:hypothetical protein